MDGKIGMGNGTPRRLLYQSTPSKSELYRHVSGVTGGVMTFVTPYTKEAEVWNLKNNCDVPGIRYHHHATIDKNLLNLSDSSFQKDARYLKTGEFLRAGSVLRHGVLMPQEEVVYPSLG
jgi:hypothetical protein